MTKEVVAIDGKTLRRSHDKKNSKAAIHMVSAWAADRQLVLSQLKTAEKSNDMTTIAELIEFLIVEGCLLRSTQRGAKKPLRSSLSRIMETT